MGRIYISYLDQDTSLEAIDKSLGNQAAERSGEEQKAGALLYVCKNCKVHFADATNLISKVWRVNVIEDANQISNLFDISVHSCRHSEERQEPRFSSAACKSNNQVSPITTPEEKQECANSSLFRINVFMGPESEKTMMTGVHIVSDVYCIQCSTVIGWTCVSTCRVEWD